MSKTLEEFYKLKQWYVLKMVEGNEFLLRENEKEMLDIIETELKRLEQIDNSTIAIYEEITKKLKALEIIKNCICGEYELKDSCDTNNPFNSPYRFRIYMSEYEYNEWILKSEEEYDLLKEVLLCQQ